MARSSVVWLPQKPIQEGCLLLSSVHLKRRRGVEGHHSFPSFPSLLPSGHHYLRSLHAANPISALLFSSLFLCPIRGLLKFRFVRFVKGKTYLIPSVELGQFLDSDMLESILFPDFSSDSEADFEEETDCEVRVVKLTAACRVMIRHITNASRNLSEC